MKVTIEGLNNKIKSGYNKLYHKGKDGVKCIKVTKPVIGNIGPNVININKVTSVKTPIWLENEKTKGTITVDSVLNPKNARNVVIIHNVIRTDPILLSWIIAQLTFTLGKEKVSVIRTSQYETSYKFLDTIKEDSLVLYVGHYIYIKDYGTDKYGRSQNLLTPLTNRGIEYEAIDSSLRCNSDVKALNKFFSKVGIKYTTKELSSIVYGFYNIGDRRWDRSKTDTYLIDIFDIFQIITAKEFESIWKVLDLDKQVDKIVSGIQGTTPDLYKNISRGNCVLATTTVAKVLMSIVKKTKHPKVLQLDTHAGNILDVVCCEEVIKKLGKCLLVKYISDGPFIDSSRVDYHLYVSNEYVNKADLEDILKIVIDLAHAGENVTIHKAKLNGK